MTRTATGLLAFGVLLFIGIVATQEVSAVLATLRQVGWGLLWVALFHLLPLVLDAVAIWVLFIGVGPGRTLGAALLARWAGESANSLMPAGQIGGPVLMARQLARHGMPLHDAAAAITVSTTLQTFAQILFALFGVLLLGLHTSHLTQQALRTTALLASGVLAVQLGGFYWLQRRGIYTKLIRTATRLARKRDWSGAIIQAAAIDRAVEAAYARRGAGTASFVFSLVGWLVGTGEVYLFGLLLGTPLTWADSLLLESLGQAIRGAGFAVPGALGVQEGGYLLLAPLVGMAPSTALALSLAKRARELLLGVPGLLFIHFSSSGRA